MLHSEDINYNVCTGGLIRGHAALKQQLMLECNSGFTIEEINIDQLDSEKNIAVEKGNWLIQTYNGEKLRGRYISEWHLIDDKWLIVSHIGCPGY